MKHVRIMEFWHDKSQNWLPESQGYKNIELWRPRREDVVPLLLLILLPLLMALPQLLGYLLNDPVLMYGGITEGYKPGLLPGLPYTDANNGFTTQALGYLGAHDWIHGHIPWWNAYSGVGLPLAAEFQSAVFFPLSLVLLLPNGMAWMHLVLQIIAGLGAYFLLRQLGLGRLAALTGGVLFAFNGALAWFEHAPANPVPFIPWFLLGIERAFAKGALGELGGWRLLAVALGLMLVSGFPETAYIAGLLGVAWVAVRWVQVGKGRRWPAVWRLGLGLVVGVGMAAPQIMSFLQSLSHSYLGMHNGSFAHAALSTQAWIPSFVAPCAYGPIGAFSANWQLLGGVWGSLGGYVTFLLLVLAIYGAISRSQPLLWLLVAWVVATAMKSFGLEPLTAAWNLIPGIAENAFFRYATPTWALAVIILAAFGIDALAQKTWNKKSALLILGLTTILGLLLVMAYGLKVWPNIQPVSGLRWSALVSVSWVAFSALAVLVVLAWGAESWRVKAVSTLVMVEAMGMFFIPTLSNPRSGTVDRPSIEFLQNNLGLHRFYTLGPIAPNYGAYFRIASINHNYLPVAQNWVSWIKANLDSAADPISFTGNFPRAQGEPTEESELRKNRANYEWLGVKYIVARAGENPFVDKISTQTLQTGNMALVLNPGDAFSGRLPIETFNHAEQVDSVDVLLGNYGNTARGLLSIELCSDGHCASGQSELASSLDNSNFSIPLDTPLTVSAGSVLRYTITHKLGGSPVAIWLYPVAPDFAQDVKTSTGKLFNGYGAQLHLRLVTETVSPPLAYSDAVMSIYKLANPAPYFETIGAACNVKPNTREQVAISCAAPAKLIRRELFYPGWHANVDGHQAKIGEYKGLFQLIDIPAGNYVINFSYSPPHIIWAWIAMWVSFFIMAASLISLKRADKSSRQKME